MNYSELFQLALGNLGALVILMVLVLGFGLGRIIPKAQHDRELEREIQRTDKVDAQADKMLAILNDILHRLDLADEKEKWRREGQ